VITYLYSLVPAEAQMGMMYLALIAGCSFLFGFFVSMGFKAHQALVSLRMRVITSIKYKISERIAMWRLGKENYLNWKNS